MTRDKMIAIVEAKLGTLYVTRAMHMGGAELAKLVANIGRMTPADLERVRAGLMPKPRGN